MPQRPHEAGTPEQDGPSPTPPPAALEAKTDSFLVRFLEPHSGQGVPRHLEERTRISLSRPHFSQ